MGSPICGAETFFYESISKRVNKILDCQNKLTDLKNPQVELLLLRSCLSLCKINHLIRTVPCAKIQEQLSEFDHGLRRSLETILLSSISDMAWKQASLPIRLGGLGLREASRSSSAAFIGSCNASRPVALRLLHGQLHSSATDEEILFFPGEHEQWQYLQRLLPDIKDCSQNATQHHLQSLLDSSLSNSLKHNASLRDRARLNTISAQHAGAWLRALPNSNLGLAMPQKEFMISLRLWLGISLFASDSARCPCKQTLDRFGDHLLGCGQGNWRIRRHDAICDVFLHALSVDNANCRREQRCTADNQSRPGDVFHPDFEQGSPTYFDISIRNSFQTQYITKAAQYAGAAAEAGENEKDRRHEAFVTATGGIFHPLVVETFGLWTNHSLSVIKTIARRLAFHGNLSVSKATTNLHEQLSTKLWLYNAKMILYRLSLDCSDSAVLSI